MTEEDELFHQIEDVYAILVIRGVYKQVKIYKRKSKIYASYGGGYIRLMAGGNTSHPNVRWDHIESHPHIVVGPQGRRFDVIYAGT